MSTDMALEALLKLNSLGAEYEVSVSNEIMVSVRCLIKPEISTILVPNVYYGLFNEYGTPIVDCDICLRYDRRFLKFHIHGSTVLEIDYQDGSYFIFPEWKKSGILEELGYKFFNDLNFLSP